MWLLNVKTRKLTYFHDGEDVRGGYVILSHTWGEEEVTFYDLEKPEVSNMEGYRKIHFTCRQALKDGYQYAWVDTCCIDKKSSAELSEAINSMFRYYQAAGRCYVYLSDVTISRLDENAAFEDVWSPATTKQFRDSRWFTRGWTLQELIAPRALFFYDENWRFLGVKSPNTFDTRNEPTLTQLLANITLIDIDVLRDPDRVFWSSVARRMSWAAGRRTTRSEDAAYCLLGLFNVNMPLLYGEGVKAFERLQEEIVRQARSNDHSILAWVPDPRDFSTRDYERLFARSAYEFRHSGNIISWGSLQADTFELGHTGLRMDICRVDQSLQSRISKADGIHEIISLYSNDKTEEVALNCRYEDEPLTQIVIRVCNLRRLAPLVTSRNLDPEILFVRRVHDTFQSLRSIPAPIMYSPGDLREKETIVLGRETGFPAQPSCDEVHLVLDAHCFIKDVYPRENWDQQLSLLKLCAANFDNRGFQILTRFAVAVYDETMNLIEEAAFRLTSSFYEMFLNGHSLQKELKNKDALHPSVPETIWIEGTSIDVSISLVTIAEKTLWCLYFKHHSDAVLAERPRLGQQ